MKRAPEKAPGLRPAPADPRRVPDTVRPFLDVLAQLLAAAVLRDEERRRETRDAH